jgi:hypothetical protein
MVMDRRELPAFDLSKAEQSLSDHDLEAANGGANMVAGLGGPDTRKDTDHTKWIDLISVSY